jgi:hypothetical protein
MRQRQTPLRPLLRVFRVMGRETHQPRLQVPTFAWSAAGASGAAGRAGVGAVSPHIMNGDGVGCVTIGRYLNRSSPGKAASLLHISQETMESYAMRTLPELEAEPLEVHLFSCRECRNRLLTLLRAAEKQPQT